MNVKKERAESPRGQDPPRHPQARHACAVGEPRPRSLAQRLRDTPIRAKGAEDCARGGGGAQLVEADAEQMLRTPPPPRRGHLAALQLTPTCLSAALCRGLSQSCRASQPRSLAALQPCETETETETGGAGARAPHALTLRWAPEGEVCAGRRARRLTTGSRCTLRQPPMSPRPTGVQRSPPITVCVHVCLRMSTCVCVCMYLCVYLHLCVHTCACAYMCVCVHLCPMCVRVCAHVRLCLCTCVCISGRLKLRAEPQA